MRSRASANVCLSPTIYYRWFNVSVFHPRLFQNGNRFIGLILLLNGWDRSWKSTLNFFYFNNKTTMWLLVLEIKRIAWKSQINSGADLARRQRGVDTRGWGGVVNGGSGVGRMVELKLNKQKKKWLPTGGCDPLPPPPPPRSATDDCILKMSFPTKYKQSGFGYVLFESWSASRIHASLFPYSPTPLLPVDYRHWLSHFTIAYYYKLRVQSRLVPANAPWWQHLVPERRWGRCGRWISSVTTTAWWLV